MDDFDSFLTAQLDHLRQQTLHRQLRKIDSAQGIEIEANGRRLINFSSNDYLGLANHAALKDAAIEAVGRFGTGCGASRLISGSLAPHHLLEEKLASFKGTEAGLTFSSGYAAAVGTLTALMQKSDVIVLDKKVHASLVDGARLSSALLRVFKHNDLNDLDRILRSIRERLKTGRVLVVVESVYSMDGDFSPLNDLVQLKEKYEAWLLVDEAHATGLFGTHRRGRIEECGLDGKIEIQLGTLGKALGSAGGFVCGSRPLIEFLINRARSFIFSTAPVPAASAAARRAIELVESEEGENLLRQLWARVNAMKNSLVQAGWPLTPIQSAIIPIIVGHEQKALELSAQLFERGFFIPAIRYPSVGRGQARLRLTLSASHQPDHIRGLMECLDALRHTV